MKERVTVILKIAYLAECQMADVKLLIETELCISLSPVCFLYEKGIKKSLVSIQLSIAPYQL